jgi:hypothetical protein
VQNSPTSRAVPSPQQLRRRTFWLPLRYAQDASHCSKFKPISSSIARSFRVVVALSSNVPNRVAPMLLAPPFLIRNIFVIASVPYLAVTNNRTALTGSTCSFLVSDSASQRAVCYQKTPAASAERHHRHHGSLGASFAICLFAATKLFATQSTSWVGWDGPCGARRLAVGRQSLCPPTARVLEMLTT